MLKLQAEARETFGKQLKRARKDGKMPAVMYGAGTESTPLFVPLPEFKKVLKEAGESTVVVVETPAGTKEVLIHEVEVHPVSEEPLHADFYVIDKTKAIQVAVPLRFGGIAPALKLGGTLVKVMHELEIETLPMTIPHELEVDTTALVDLASQILVKDIYLPPGVMLISEPEEVVAAIAVAKEEVEEAPADLSAIEVEKKGKKEEEGTEATPPPQE
jgi:large subunit ribosomal protein L25